MDLRECRAVHVCEVYKQRSEQYGPIYKETFGDISTVVISDLDEYDKVIVRQGHRRRRTLPEPHRAGADRTLPQQAPHGPRHRQRVIKLEFHGTDTDTDTDTDIRDAPIV